MELITVRVIGLPLDLAARSQEHHDGLTREMTLLAMELDRDSDGRPSLPARLVALVRDFSASFSGFGDSQRGQLEDAAAAGKPSVDLVYHPPPVVGHAVERLREMQDEVDGFCRRGGYLLTLETPPDVRAYRSWLFEEFIGQAAGRAPRPWRPSSALNVPSP